MNRLNKKTMVITGGNSGIGYATAKVFAEEGAKVIITGRNAKAIAAAAAELNVSSVIGDQGSMVSIGRMVAEIQKKYGTIDTVLLNAGIATFSPFETASEEHFDSLLDTNLKGVFFTLQAVLPLINDGGSVIFNTSINANVGTAGSAAYAASKGAALSLSRVLATQLAPRKIRVNSISPGPVQTPAYGKLGMSSEDTAAFGEILAKKILLNRFGQAEKIGKLALLLASDESTFINGTEISIDGGLTVNPVLN
jgi:NAD(P)-dependent dehydrogenase (short-subunit alcohol dehydrogenase family)